MMLVKIRQVLLILATLLGIALWLSMLHSPEPQWDEGWTMTVARTWVEQGVYAQPLDGTLIAPSLAASFPTVVPVALAFKLLGVGYWQGRMAIALLNLLSLAALALLARRLYGVSVGIMVIPTLLLTTIHVTGNPLFVGRQAMGEPAMMLLLCLAFFTMLPALAGSWRWMLVTVGLFGLALVTKAQTLPFWIVAMFAPLPLLFWRRHLVMLVRILVIIVGSLGAARLIAAAWNLLVFDPTLPVPEVVGLTRTVATVFTLASRQLGLLWIGAIAVPALLGMAWASWGIFRQRLQIDWGDPIQIVRVSILAFVLSWLGWFLFLAVAWARYLYPVVFLGAIFTTAMLTDWTGDFRPAEVLRRLRSGGRPGYTALVALTVLCMAPPATVFHQIFTYPISTDQPLLATSAWIKAHVPADARVETNETELFVSLDQPYHFPPYQEHVVANQRLLLHESVPFTYDPLVADPDYLVTGRQEQAWQLYAPYIEAGHFQLLQEFGVYRIYARLRP
ncbi:hypothetical protein [Candidatus Oscillochloris fontis]|uniref:hypothetical protein n=1 Tax=Candidatus Oscillochloris fontis TaxID=2496868 RepID=UPI00101C92EF|nr:hypothetical protein [Candidatus Oscillochloris fontis]